MKMVSLRDAIYVGLRLRSARRMVRVCAAGGVWGGMPRTSSAIFCAGVRNEKKKVKTRAAHFHHLSHEYFIARTDILHREENPRGSNDLAEQA